MLIKGKMVIEFYKIEIKIEVIIFLGNIIFYIKFGSLINFYINIS